MSRDLRRYASQTQARLILGGLLFAVVIGVGLIYIFYGREAALSGLLCMLVGMAPLALIWLALSFIGWLARRAGE